MDFRSHIDARGSVRWLGGGWRSRTRLALNSSFNFSPAHEFASVDGAANSKWNGRRSDWTQSVAVKCEMSNASDDVAIETNDARTYEVVLRLCT